MVKWKTGLSKQIFWLKATNRWRNSTCINYISSYGLTCNISVILKFLTAMFGDGVVQQKLPLTSLRIRFDADVNDATALCLDSRHRFGTSSIPSSAYPGGYDGNIHLLPGHSVNWYHLPNSGRYGESRGSSATTRSGVWSANFLFECRLCSWIAAYFQRPTYSPTIITAQFDCGAASRQRLTVSRRVTVLVATFKLRPSCEGS